MDELKRHRDQLRELAQAAAQIYSKVRAGIPVDMPASDSPWDRRAFRRQLAADILKAILREPPIGDPENLGKLAVEYVDWLLVALNESPHPLTYKIKSHETDSIPRPDIGAPQT